jgi:predicted ribonuclease YlaK
VSLCLRERNRQAPPRYNTHGIARSDSPHGHTARRFSSQLCAAWVLTEARRHRAKTHSEFCCFLEHRLAISSVPLCLRERNRQAPPQHITHKITHSDSLMGIPHSDSLQNFARDMVSHRGTELKHTLGSAASGNTALRLPPCLCASVREIVKHLRETTPTKSLTAIRLWAYRTAILYKTSRAT